MNIQSRLLLAFGLGLIAQQVVAAPVATIVSTQGAVALVRGDASRAAVPGSVVEPGDVLKTGPGTEVQAAFADGSKALLAQDSSLRFEGGAGVPALSLLTGGVRRQDLAQPATLDTPMGAVSSARDTDYAALVCAGNCAGQANGLHVQVFRGSVDLRNASGTLRLGAGGTGFISSVATAAGRPAAPTASDPTPNAVAATTPELTTSNSQATSSSPAAASSANPPAPPTRESSASPSSPSH